MDDESAEYLLQSRDGQTVDDRDRAVSTGQFPAKSHLDLFFELTHSPVTTQSASSKE
jgi:hypothetical protein